MDVRSLTMLALVVLGGCGSVELPEQRTYRIELPPPATADGPEVAVLRVGELALAADLQGDRLMVADSPVAVRAYRHHRWAGPLERMLADAFVTGLERAGCFAQVKDATARGTEDYLLTGRVLEFHQAPHDGRWCGRARLGLQLVDRDGRLVFQREFTAETDMDGGEPGDLALALSRSVATIVDEVVATCDATGVFAAPPPAPGGR